MLIRTVETFLKEHDMPATKFGRLAAHDPRFVLDLRMGRIQRPRTEARTRQWMRDYALAAKMKATAEANANAAVIETKSTAPAPRHFAQSEMTHVA
ncbi:MAG: hypothetical protein AAF687_12310 [Pseudomonadota bacterium]